VLYANVGDEGRQLELLAVLWVGELGLQSGIHPRDGNVEITNLEERGLEDDVAILAAELAGERDIDVHAITWNHELADHLVSDHGELHGLHLRRPFLRLRRRRLRTTRRFRRGSRC